MTYQYFNTSIAWFAHEVDATKYSVKLKKKNVGRMDRGAIRPCLNLPLSRYCLGQ